MIIVKSYKVLFDKAGNPELASKYKVVTKFKNNHVFPFDIFKPKQWRIFLSTYRTDDGKLLPSLSAVGDPIVYSVYTWGTARWMKEGMPLSLREKHKFKVISFFPGYNNEGELRSVERLGLIR